MKSKSELRREFVSPQVLDRLKEASRYLVDEKPMAKSKGENVAPGIDKLIPPASSIPDAKMKSLHPDLNVVNMQSSAAADS